MDVTKRKEFWERFRESEENLRISEAQYRGIFENAVEAIYQTTLEGKSLAANPVLARILGYDSLQEILSTVTDTAHRV